MSGVARPTAEIDVFPFSRSCPFSPPDRYAELREREPISQLTLPNGRRAWLVTRYEHLRQVLLSKSVTSDRTHPGFGVTPVPRTRFGGVSG